MKRYVLACLSDALASARVQTTQSERQYMLSFDKTVRTFKRLQCGYEVFVYPPECNWIAQQTDVDEYTRNYRMVLPVEPF